MRRVYLTEYRAGFGGVFGNKIAAPSLRGARRLARHRGLREKVLGEGDLGIDVPCTVFLRRRGTTPAQRLHAIAFLSFVALRAKVATVDDVLDDEQGILHQWAHWEMFKASREPKGSIHGTKAALLRRVRKIERRIPGYPA